jgi:phasin family protein
MAGKTNKTATSAPEDAIAAGQEALQDFIKTNQQAYQKVFGGSQEQMEKVMGGYGDFGDQGKANMDALVTAGQTYAKGMEALTADWFAFSKSLIEANVTASKDAFAAKTLTDVVELQAAHVQKATDDVMAQTAKASEMGTKIVQDAAAPLNSRISANMEKLSNLAA